MRPEFAIVLGTRPEIIKLSPVILGLANKKMNYILIHSNQHYSYELDRIFFRDLGLPEPHFNLNIGSDNHGAQTGRMMIELEKVLAAQQPSIVVVQGDTNTTLAASLSATKLHIPVCHIEAGLRSHDKDMPEEINRIVADHCSDWLFAPTVKSEENLILENIPRFKIRVVGNTIVDAIKRYFPLSVRFSSILSILGLESHSYILVTLHRAENVDSATKLSSVFNALQQIKNLTGLPIILPIHPRTRKCIQANGISTEGINIIEPLGYFDFLNLESNARLILTDSGGVQEESCILKIPCVTLRENTERPETVDIGANIIAGHKESDIIRCVSLMLQKEPDWENPFGDGDSSSRIIEFIETLMHSDEEAKISATVR